MSVINRVFDGWSWRNLDPNDPFDFPDPDEREVKRVGNIRVLLSKYYINEYADDLTRFAMRPRTTLRDPVEELLYKWKKDPGKGKYDLMYQAVEMLQERSLDPITIARAARRYTEIAGEDFLTEYVPPHPL